MFKKLFYIYISIHTIYLFPNIERLRKDNIPNKFPLDFQLLPVVSKDCEGRVGMAEQNILDKRNNLFQLILGYHISSSPLKHPRL